MRVKCVLWFVAVGMAARTRETHMFTYTGEWPRTYWVGLTDEQLVDARNEYLSTDIEELHRIAADIDDDLILRAALREAEEAGSSSLAFLACTLLALVPVSLVVVFVARLAGAVAGVMA